MAEAIGQVLTLAVGVALSPVPIIAVVLMLGTPRAKTNGPAFVLGWLIGLSLVGIVVLLASGGADASEEDGPATWVSILKLALGALLLGIAARQWRGRPRGDAETPLPKWMEAIDRFTPARSAAMALALSGINPKNLVLTVSAAAAIAQTGASTGGQAVALTVFVVLGTLGPGIPVAVYFVMGDQASHLLDDLRTRMGRHNAAIMAAICLVIGAKLIGDGISGL